MVELRRSTRLLNQKRTHEDTKDGYNKLSKPNQKRPKVMAQKKHNEVIELQVGDDIPNLTLLNQDNEPISLQKVSKDKKIMVIFAYPKASTPGCTKQACGYRDNYEELQEHALILGLSADSVKSQKNFQIKQSLPFDLLSDPKRELIGLLGAKKTPQAGITRSHWVFVDGKLVSKRIKISPELSVESGKNEILKLIENK